MYKFFILSVFFVSLLISAAHAGRGRLVLEANLSDEQTAVVKQKIIDPYVQNTIYNIKRDTTPPTSLIRTERFRHRELPGMSFPYPSLQALKTMVYTTTLIFQIDGVDAKNLAKQYQKTMSFLELNQIDVDFFADLRTHNYQQFHVDIGLPTKSPQLNWLNGVIQSICSQEKEYKLGSSGTIVCCKTTLSNTDRDDRGSLQFEAMKQKIADLNSTNDKLSFTFKSFNLKYIDDKDTVIFSYP